MTDKLSNFRAIIVQHNWRGSTCLCIGAEGYSKDSFVCLPCTEEDQKRFPVGTLFDLVPVPTHATRAELAALVGIAETTPGEEAWYAALRWAAGRTGVEIQRALGSCESRATFIATWGTP